jgi:hypothetical protein
LTADADRRVRPLQRLRIAVRVDELDVPAGEGRLLVREQPDDRLTCLVEGVEPLGERGVEVDAVGLGLHLVPPRADAELEATARHDVERGGHVGEHRRMTVRHAGHEHADAQAPGCLRQRSGGDPAFETGARHVVGEDRVEVVEGPRRLEELDLVGGLPDRQHVRPRRFLR